MVLEERPQKTAGGATVMPAAQKKLARGLRISPCQELGEKKTSGQKWVRLVCISVFVVVSG